MQKTLYTFCLFFITFFAFSQDEVEYSAKEIQTRRISKILIWEQQAAWDKENNAINKNDSCVYLEKEYDTKGRLIATTENYCPEKMHHRGDYFTYDNLGRITAFSRSEYGIGEVEFRGIRYEDFTEYDSIVYDQGMKQTKVIEYDANKKMISKKTYQDATLYESHEYNYNSKGILIGEIGMRRGVEFQKKYQHNSNDSIILEKVYQGEELIQKEQFEYNADGTRKNYYHITYQDTDSIVQLIHYEYFSNKHIKKITISENDEKGVFHLIEVNEYDKNDNLIRTENRIDAANPAVQELTYTSKRQSKSIVWKVNGKMTAQANYEYNNHDLLIDYEYKENNSHLHVHHIYNKDDLLIEKIFTTDKKLSKKYHYTYAYFRKL